jgi:hypothetical protein
MASSNESSSGATAYPQGSPSNPYVIKVDFKLPKSNWEFEVTFVSPIIHAGWSCSGYCIWKELGIANKHFSETLMRREPPYHNTSWAILIQGLKRSSAYERWQSFNPCEDHCVSLKEMMSTTTAAMKIEQEHKMAFFLLVFPVEIELDNVILSGGRKVIEMKKIGSRYITAKIATVSMFVYWMIAIGNSAHRVPILKICFQLIFHGSSNMSICF